MKIIRYWGGKIIKVSMIIGVLMIIKVLKIIKVTKMIRVLKIIRYWGVSKFDKYEGWMLAIILFQWSEYFHSFVAFCNPITNKIQKQYQQEHKYHLK